MLAHTKCECTLSNPFDCENGDTQSTQCAFTPIVLNRHSISRSLARSPLFFCQTLAFATCSNLRTLNNMWRCDMKHLFQQFYVILKYYKKKKRNQHKTTSIWKWFAFFLCFALYYIATVAFAIAIAPAAVVFVFSSWRAYIQYPVGMWPFSILLMKI